MLTTNSDGGSRGNPGPGAIGVIVRNEGTILSKYSGFIGRNVTNNMAEYEALIMALRMAIRHGKKVSCILDSELVVKQLLGEYKVRDKKLLPLFLKVQKLQENFDEIIYKHISREDQFQTMADELVNEELDSNGFKQHWRK
ncbi:MAG: ribonuclease HI family protein [Candidatus Pacearchaeota archaeon]